ncbi:MAG: nuclear transport factor 2 family protein [Candidatus Binatia bacterium]
MAADDEFERRLRQLEDREAIRELMNQYCFIQDRGHQSHAEDDVSAFLALCHPDVVWDNSSDGSRAHRGREAVAAYLRELWARFDDCMHFVHNLSVAFESDSRARGRASFEAVGGMNGEAFVAAGTYEDEYVRTSDGWRFLLHREVPFFFVKANESWAGPKPKIMREWLQKGTLRRS